MDDPTFVFEDCFAQILSEITRLRSDFERSSQTSHAAVERAISKWALRRDSYVEEALQPRLGQTSSSRSSLSPLPPAAPERLALHPPAAPERLKPPPHPQRIAPPGAIDEAPVVAIDGDEEFGEILPSTPASEETSSFARSAGLGARAQSDPGAIASQRSSKSVQQRRKRVKKTADQFLFAEKKAEVASAQTWLLRITSSKAFDAVFVLLILVNAVTIGWQVQYIADRTREGTVEIDMPGQVVLAQGLLCLMFVLEMALRWTADGLFDFFRTANAAWNVFDLATVTIGVFEIILVLTAHKGIVSSLSVIRVFRIMRILRVARVIRVLTFFHELRLMIDSIIRSLKSFVWCMIVLTLVFYCFSIAITSGVSAHLQGLPYGPEYKALQMNFGSLETSMLSLYMAMSGGRDWGELYDVLATNPLTDRAIFLIFISFTLFAVVNVVTGVFVETAITTSGKDRELIIKEEVASQKRYLQEMEDVFEEMDIDGSGAISADEFEKHLADDRVIAYFNALKLDVTDAKKLFTLLDKDCNGSVEINEFLLGCQQLKGESRQLDVSIVHREVSQMREEVRNIQALLTRDLQHHSCWDN